MLQRSKKNANAHILNICCSELAARDNALRTTFSDCTRTVIDTVYKIVPT